MNRSAKGLLIVTTNLDDFSLAYSRRFVKFAKLSTCQTFLLYGNLKTMNMKKEYISITAREKIVHTYIHNDALPSIG